MLILQSGAIAVAILLTLMFFIVRAGKRGRGGGWFLLFLAVVATLPLSVSSLFIWFGSLHSKSEDYWATAPWLVILAHFRYSGMAVTIALITGVAYLAIPGERPKKFRWSLLCFTGLFLAALTFSGMQRQEEQKAAADHKANRHAENVAVKNFVEQNPEITDQLTGPIYTAVISWKAHDNGMPFQYIVIANEKMANQERKGVMVVVNVARTERGAQFQIACIKPKNSVGSGRDPCDEISDPPRR